MGLGDGFAGMACGSGLIVLTLLPREFSQDKLYINNNFICEITIRCHLTKTIFVWSGQIYNILVVILMCARLRIFIRIIIFVILYTTNIMSNVLTTFPYTRPIAGNLVPIFPGAYIFRGAPGNNGLVPIYTSISRFTDSGMTDILENKDAQLLVLPGFCLQLYTNTLFGTLNGTIDNSGGTDLLLRNSSAANTSSSCKLFYKFPTGYAEIPSLL